MNTKLLENETLIREGSATYFNSRLGALGSSAEQTLLNQSTIVI